MKPQENKLDDVRELFEQSDEDRDGQISLTEFRTLMFTLDPKMRDDAATGNFLKIDANRDGRIGFDEFRAWWMRG